MNCLGQSVCNHFPKYMESDCYDFVRENTDSLLELIFGNNQANRENLQQSDTLKSIKETCGMCKFLMRIIGLQLKTKPLQEGIEKSVTQVCETINRPIKAKCESFVKEFGPKLISKLQQTFEPQFICSHIKACPKELDGPIDQGVTDEVDIEHEDFLLEIVDETNLSRKPYCAVCKAVVSAAKHLIKTDYSKGHIKNTLTKICGKLHKFGDKCNKFVNQYMDRLVDALADATKRNQVCRLITVCSHLIENEDNKVEYYEEIDSNEYAIVERNDYYLEANLETSDENVGIGECIICKGIVKAVKEIVKHSFTRDKVQHALRKACEKVHSKHCSSFVNKHFNQMVSLLVAGSSRGKVCRLLMVCSAQNAFEDSLEYASQGKLEGFTSSTAEENSYYVETSLEDKEILNRNVGINECFICKGVVNAVREIVGQSFTRNNVQNALRTACQKIHYNHCSSFVNSHFNQMVNLLVVESSRGRVCTIMMVCSIQNELEAQTNDEDHIENEIPPLGSVEETGLSRKPYCAVCKAVVSAAKHLIKTDYSKGHIKSTLSKICGKLHKFGDKCNKFVNQYMDRLVDALADAAKRNQVCRLITVCSHLIENEDNEVEYYDEIDSNEYAIVERNDYYLEANLETSDENVGIGECIICKGIVKAVKEIVKHSFTRDKVQHALRKACEKVHSKHCTSFVNKHFNQMVSLLVAGSSRGKVCRLLLVCSDQNEFKDSPEYESQVKLEGFTSSTAEENSYYLETSLEDKEILNRNVEINECFICKGVVNAVREIVGQSFTRNNVQNALRTACQKIHYNHCSSFVNSHFNQMVNLLVVESSRGRVCTIMMVCSIQNELEAQTNDEDHIENEIPPLGSVEETGLSRKPYCAVCKAVVSAAKHLIKTDYSKGHIKSTLSKICGKLHKFGDKCNKFVNQYMDRLVDALADATKRNQVCRLITVCSHLIEYEDNEMEYYDETDSYVYEDNYLETNLEVSDENVGIGECIICKGIVKAVKEIVKHSFTRDKVQHALRKACEKVHSKHCTSFVNKHFNQMVSLLVAGSSRGKVCRLLLVCSAQNEFEDSLEYASQSKLEGFTSSTAEENSYYLDTSLEDKEILNRNVGINECFICKGVVNAVREIVGQSFTRNNVQNALRTACQKIHYNHCSSFVNSHFNQMVNLLVVESSRGRVCTIMMVCSIQNELAQTNDEDHIENEITPLESVEETGLSRKPYCAVCKAVVSAAKHLIKTDYSKGHIKNTLSKICAKLHKFGDKCNKFVNQYMDRLVDALADATKRNKVCRLITVCSHLIEYEDNEMEYYGEIDNYVYEDNYLETNLEVSDENDCFICKEVVKAVKEIVKDSPTRDKVQKALNTACQVHSKHCSRFVKNHFNTLAKLLVHGASGEKICRFLRVCSVEPGFQDPGSALETGAIIPSRDICNMFISKSKKIIMETLKNETYRKLACESMDKPNVFCENDLEHLDQLSELTNAILTYHVGIAMPVCMTSDNSLENRLETKVTNFRPIICRGCQFVLHIVRQVLFNNTIMHLLVRDIKILCILLPDGLKRMCVKEISQFIQYIQNINTQDACHSLSLC